MGSSALMGKRPLSDSDRIIYKALLEMSSFAINSDKRYPFGVLAPANAPYDSRSISLVVGVISAMALIIFVTGARL